jgi:cytochrome c oxidase cbb3-type subunit IV
MTEIANFLASLWGLWMMLIFIGIIAWAFWPGSKRRLERHAEIPLRDDDDDHPARRATDKD